LAPSLILTGQHPDLDPEEFGLGGLSSERLGCPGEENPHLHVRAVAAALLPLLTDTPGLIVVQGDTSSALGGALAAFTAGIPVAHVEAGLRTHDPLLPWPEEEYRSAIDAGAALLFAPTELAVRNLESEQVAGDVHVTGNTGIDALLAVEAELPAPEAKGDGPPHLLVTCHRRESWGEGLAAIAAGLIELAWDREMEIALILHPNPLVAGTMRHLLGHCDGITLLEPCPHRELVRRMRDADLILSDSGGIQEEAPALGVPLLVLRDKTERPEGVAAGTARLVGTSTQRIVREVRALLDDREALERMSRRSFPYGDGHSARRIATIIERWVTRPQSKSSQPAPVPPAAY
jgi:UDP-N-acetylglucosamine 2-epimerase (non-hydrolysing)